MEEQNIFIDMGGLAIYDTNDFILEDKPVNDIILEQTNINYQKLKAKLVN